MRASYFEAVQADLFRELVQIHGSESRSGSHDDTGAAAIVYLDNGDFFEIRPKSHVYSWTSVQNSEFEQREITDDFDAFLAKYKEFVIGIKRNPYPPMNWEANRRCFPAEGTFIKSAVIVRGSYHYGSSIRARCTVEAWRAEYGDKPFYEILHLEHVGTGFSVADGFLATSPDLLFLMGELDALKEYKK